MVATTFSYSTIMALYRLLKTSYKSQKFIRDSVENYNWNDPLDFSHRENCRSVIETSFRDMGYKHELIVLFYRKENDKRLEADITCGKNGEQPLALVRVQYGDPRSLLKNDEIYAIAAHEAAHYFRKSAKIKSLYQSCSTSLIQGALLKKGITVAGAMMGPVPLSITLFSLAVIHLATIPIAELATEVFAGKVSQFTERDADLTAARKLNIGESLAKFLREDIQHYPKKSALRTFFDSHPTHKKRIRYLEEAEANNLQLAYRLT